MTGRNRHFPDCEEFPAAYAHPTSQQENREMPALPSLFETMCVAQ
jgi:hypothetical protein